MSMKLNLRNRCDMHPQIVQIEADKARKFGGPQLGIQEKVVSLMLDEYAKVVEREYVVESIMAKTQQIIDKGVCSRNMV